MNLGKKVTVIIDTNGDAVVETHNFHGKGCAAVVKAFTDALGGKVTEDRAKPEFHELTTETFVRSVR